MDIFSQAINIEREGEYIYNEYNKIFKISKINSTTVYHITSALHLHFLIKYATRAGSSRQSLCQATIFLCNRLWHETF